MIPGARLPGNGPFATGWTPYVTHSPGWSAASTLTNPATMATYKPQTIPAQALMNDVSLYWTIDPLIPRQNIYVMQLHSVTYGVLELPMSSFQGTLKNDGTSYVSAIVPDVLEHIDNVELWVPDAYMEVYSGYRFADGSVQLEAIARADQPLNVRSDLGPQSSSITIEGYHTYAVTAPKIRELTGATYRNTIDGRRRYRCDVDTFLRPGDTASINSEQFVVSDINYVVGGGLDRMEIAEDNAQ